MIRTASAIKRKTGMDRFFNRLMVIYQYSLRWGTIPSPMIARDGLPAIPENINAAWSYRFWFGIIRRINFVDNYQSFLPIRPTPLLNHIPDCPKTYTHLDDFSL